MISNLSALLPLKKGRKEGRQGKQGKGKQIWTGCGLLQKQTPDSSRSRRGITEGWAPSVQYRGKIKLVWGVSCKKFS